MVKVVRVGPLWGFVDGGGVCVCREGVENVEQGEVVAFLSDEFAPAGVGGGVGGVGVHVDGLGGQHSCDGEDFVGAQEVG